MKWWYPMVWWLGDRLLTVRTWLGHDMYLCGWHENCCGTPCCHKEA